MISKIITHNRPHADELVALMLLRRFPEGEAKFPGVSNAKVEFLTTGELGEGKTAKDFLEIIFLGCGGGEFDEHATSQKERVEGECCATLVAKSLGVDKDPGLQKILTFVKSEDLKGTKIKNELPMIIKFLHSCHKDKYDQISKWVIDAYFAEFVEEKSKWEKIKDSFDAEKIWKESKGKWQRPTLESSTTLLRSQGYEDLDWWIQFADEALKFQDQRFKDAEIEFKEKGMMEKIMGPHSKEINLGVITSDNEEMNKYARSAGADIVVQFSTKGHVAIMTRRPAQINVTNIFMLLRMAEQFYKSGKVEVRDENILKQEATVECAPEWYLARSRELGFNGSMTATDVPYTKIPREKILECVKEGLKIRA